MRRRLLRLVGVILAAVLLLFLVASWLLPVPPLEGTFPPRALADADSRFVTINDLDVHLKTAGEGEPVFVLLHGFGASLYSWREVMPALSRFGTVIAYDRPAFGLTERPTTWQGENPYSSAAQVALLQGLLDHFDAQRVILVGHSAGGTVAMQFALAHPGRVAALILVDPAVYVDASLPVALRWLMETPQMRRLGTLLARHVQTQGLELLYRAWNDPARISAETLALYQKPLRAADWDIALWELTLASRPLGLAERLDAFAMPVLVVTGDNDRVIPPADSARLAQTLPNARLGIIRDAGHVPHEEQPQAFMQAVEAFLDGL